MYSLDDPTLALILRFVGRNQEITLDDGDFLEQQLEAIRKYVEGFPPEERQTRACEWIETYAREYRDRWAKSVVNDMFSGEQCPDCPLAGVDPGENCQIHEQWLELLRRYVGDEISARRYTEDSLALLAQHKERLRVGVTLVEERA